MKNLASKQATVIYDEALGAFHATFFNFVQHTEFVNVLEYEYEMVEHYQLKKALIDLRQMKIYAKGNEDYIKTTWFPKMKSLGLQRVAFVVPVDIFAKVTMEKAHNEEDITPTLQLKHFKTIEEAKNWLSE